MAEDLYEERCSGLRHGNLVFQLTSAFTGEIWFQVFVLGSCMCSYLLAYIIHTRSDFHVEPLGLIKFIALYDGTAAYLQFMAPYTCDLQLP